MAATFAQLFPQKPSFTEENIPSLEGRVFLVTGGTNGVGLELVKMLYAKGGTVYLPCRSATKATQTIDAIQAAYPDGTGHLKTLTLDLNDLASVAACASAFLAQESRLDVLWNNAGISYAPSDELTVQGYEPHMGINCLGPFLLTKLLLPVLKQTARISPAPSTRVVFIASGLVDSAPPGGIPLAELTPGNQSKDLTRNYSISKTGDWFLASEFDRRTRSDGILFLAQNPGNLMTNIWDRVPWVIRASVRILLHPPKRGAYSELWAGLSPEIKLEDGGRYGIPWGKWHPNPRKDLLQSLKPKDSGGTGLAAEFWHWCDEQTKDFVYHLVQEPAGDVIGAELQTATGSITIRATRGVILAAGGFARNLGMREHFMPKAASIGRTSSPKGDMGDAIQEGMRLGAVIALLDDAWWGPTILDPVTSKVTFALFERTRPHSFIVDSMGERLMNEAQSYTDAGHDQYARNVRVKAIPTWLIMDTTHRNKYMLDDLLPRMKPSKEALAKGRIFGAPSLTQLARQIEVDPEGLSNTAERYNDMCRKVLILTTERGTLLTNNSLGILISSQPQYGALEHSTILCDSSLAWRPGNQGWSFDR